MITTPGALVLAGGGVAGIAWETGFLLGLADEDSALVARLMADSTTVIGSAGATVAAQLAGGTPLPELYDRQLDPQTAEILVTIDLAEFGATMMAALAGATSPQQGRQRLGTLAMTAETAPPAVRRAVIEARLPHPEWPGRPMLITAVDTTTGALRVFDRASGVGLVDAVAASCAVPGIWPPVDIHDQLYMDGGVRTVANADLAAGAEQVLVMVPSAPESPLGPAVSADELAALAPGRVHLVFADDASLAPSGPIRWTLRPAPPPPGPAGTSVGAAPRKWRRSGAEPGRGRYWTQAERSVGAGMSSMVRRSMMSGLVGLRHEPSAKRIRAALGDQVVLDTTRAALLWEPRRVVASWAVPVDDVSAELLPAGTAAAADGDVGLALPDIFDRPVLDPSIPFTVHTAEGEVVDVRAGEHIRPGAGLRLVDPDLAGYVVLDFGAFDTWWEEDEVNVGHPREPFHRIDVLPSSRAVRLELDREVLAESTRPLLLFETMLPTRFYLPRADVRVELVPSPTRTTCAYKGHASYWSPVVGGREVGDLAWTYEEPLREAAQVAGLVAFFDERVDVTIDGIRRERPITPWS